MKITKTLYISTLFICSLGCSQSENKESGVKNINTEISTETTEDEKTDRIKTIFYSLPSPLELILMFKSEGISYQVEKLHSTESRKNYVLRKDKALNLGVYGADLSYSGLFAQHEMAIQYFAASQILADDLGIGGTFQGKFISRLEENANNRDTLIQVVSDFFLENDKYLKSEGQQDLSILILAGGWIEGMYLGTQMVDENTNAEGIKEIIINQKTSLHNLLVLLQDLHKTKELRSFIKEIGDLETHYNKLEDANAEDEVFIAIKDKVASIRNNIITVQ